MRRYLYYIFVFLLVVGCSNGEEPQHGDDGRQRVNVALFAESGEMGNDIRAGLYMVNYYDKVVEDLLPVGNYVDNQMVVYRNNAWQTEQPIYWYDDTTPADFYVYAPYNVAVENACALPFCVAADQSTKQAMTQSDFLWGASLYQYPLDGNFELTMRHHFCKMTVVVTSDGTLGELTADNVAVAIGGTKTASTINLQTGDLATTGEVHDVKCYNNGNLSYTAILIPQQVPFSNFIKIDLNGNPYALQSAFNLESRKEYRMTVKLKKTAGGFDVGIDGWDIIDEDFGGVVGGV